MPDDGAGATRAVPRAIASRSIIQNGWYAEARPDWLAVERGVRPSRRDGQSSSVQES